jgi:hypothetical protein
VGIIIISSADKQQCPRPNAMPHHAHQPLDDPSHCLIEPSPPSTSSIAHHVGCPCQRPVSSPGSPLLEDYPTCASRLPLVECVSVLGREHPVRTIRTTVRQISVTPFSHGWHRFAAVLTEVYGQTTLHLQSWKGGVTPGTNRFDPNGFADGGKSGKSGIAPIEGSILKHGKQSKHDA